MYYTYMYIQCTVIAMDIRIRTYVHIYVDMYVCKYNTGNHIVR